MIDNNAAQGHGELTVTNLVKTYDKKRVLDDITLTIEPGKIYGLIGRNGAGKTTLLSILTAQNTWDSGQVTYENQDIWENQQALDNICFSRELNALTLFGQNTTKLRDLLRTASYYYPYWNKQQAEQLTNQFELELKKPIYKLSKGMMSMATIVIALASQAPITMLDEPVAGLDVVMRERFYQLLLEDYMKTNRTFIVSTHIIDEAADVMEEIIFLDKGKLLAMENTEEYVSRYRYLSGEAQAVDTMAEGLPVIHSENRGRSKQICVVLDSTVQLPANPDVKVSGVPLHKIFYYLTEKAGLSHEIHK